MRIRIETLSEACIQVLQNHKTPTPLAKKVIQDLLSNEYQGHSSHGILRILEYVESIKQENILPKNKPKVSHLSPHSTIIDGQKSFGCIAKETIISALTSHLKTQGFGFVSLINSGHFGRLRNIAAPLSEMGGIVIGFANFSGAGQNVPPYGGEEGRLCTNPMVFSVPGPLNEPIVLDMSTTSVAEGKVREAYLKQKKVPKGWLIDKNWQDITDPQKFYERPQTAFLSPLGGIDFGYKGFGLALITEILSGILTGGGFSQKNPVVQGNSAFFIVVSSDVFGQSSAQFQKSLQDLLSYIDSCPTAVGFKNIKIPGIKMNALIEKNKKKEDMEISKDLWQKICELMND